MEVRAEIFELLKTDHALVRKIAIALDLKESSVLRWAYREQHRCVGLYSVVKIIMKHTGLKESEIFEPIEVCNTK